MLRLLVLAGVVATALTASAPAHVGRLPGTAPAVGSVDEACPGEPIAADEVITGHLSADREGSHVMVPFTVPDGTTAVRVKYCHDQPEVPSSTRIRHTLDFGLYEPPIGGNETWGPVELRGWGGSSHPDVTVSAEGFAPYGEQAPGKTTRAFRPGPIRDGRWAAELGLAVIAGPEGGDADGGVAYRLEIELSDDPAFADEPYEPAPYRTAPVRRRAGWYAGDAHVHGEHSDLAGARFAEIADYAFGPAGLDFVAISEYVGSAHRQEIGRVADDHPDDLMMRSTELITYRGHVTSHAAGRPVDHRTGRVLERRPDGSLSELRPAEPASRLLRDIRTAGGVTQLNHPTVFPSPTSRLFCRGCPWDYTAEETDFGLVDAIEVATGPGGLQEVPGGLGPNPFTATAIEFYENALRSGAHIAAVGSSDSHRAGRREDPVTQSPVGQATTMVYARELSEAGISCAIRAGHTYVKVWGADRPDLRLEATVDGIDGKAIFGDTVRARSVRFRARVLDAAPLEGQPYTLQVVKDGAVLVSNPVTGGELDLRFAALGPGRYGLRLVRGSTIEAVSTPIWVEPPGPRGPTVARRTCSDVVRATRTRRVHRARAAALRHRDRQVRAHRRAVKRARAAAS